MGKLFNNNGNMAIVGGQQLSITQTPADLQRVAELERQQAFAMYSRVAEQMQHNAEFKAEQDRQYQARLKQEADTRRIALETERRNRSNAELEQYLAHWDTSNK